MGAVPRSRRFCLLPVAISKKEGSNSYYLASIGNFQLNLVQLHVLEDQFKFKLHPEELLAEFADDENECSVLDIKGLCEKIQRTMADARGFEIELRVILGRSFTIAIFWNAKFPRNAQMNCRCMM
jgi:hypothetical protein